MIITYRNIDCSKMTEREIYATSELFSEHYGKWSIACESSRAGQPIRFSASMIRKYFVEKPDCKVALAYCGERLVGHIFYLRRKGRDFGYITWILQLVVNTAYRGQRIGTKMMQSIWGLSNSYACGLYTSNPMTIKTLEMATMRSVNETIVKKQLEKLKSIAKDLFADMNWINNYCDGFVDTNFQTDRTELKRFIRKAYPNDDFPLNPNLPEGKEWLAFTFRSQKPMISDIKELEQYLEFSEDVLVQAYSNMRLDNHSWAKHTVREADYIQRFLPPTGNMMDFGCGTGRHCIEFSKRGWQTYGIDFCNSHITTAIERAQEQCAVNAHFCCCDARNYKALTKMDAILCLYDVVGSFPSDVDNLHILKNAYRNLRNDGVLLLSVMNMILTSTRCKKNTVYGIENHIDRLLKLEGSNTMQKTGDIFDGKHILLDDCTGIIYRKEQFFSENALPVEYIVRDRRYTLSGIQQMVKKAGFAIVESYFVQAGRLDLPLQSSSRKAKEIFIVARKDKSFNGVFNALLPLGKTWH